MTVCWAALMARLVRWYMKKFLLAVLAAVIFAPTVVASAHADDSDMVVCAAIHPCNEDGTVQAPFDQGVCGERYALECAKEKESLDAQNPAETSCVADRDTLSKQVKRLSKQLRIERAKHRRGR